MIDNRIKEVTRTVFVFDCVGYDSIEEAKLAVLEKDLCDKIVELTNSHDRFTQLHMDIEDLADFLSENKEVFKSIFNGFLI